MSEKGRLYRPFLIFRNGAGAAACRCTQFRADDLYETEVSLRERYNIRKRNKNYAITPIRPSRRRTAARCPRCRLRADSLSETEVPLREHYKMGILYTKLSHSNNLAEPSKDGGEESKIGKGKEEEGEEKESAERKNVGRRREGNADFCASFVVPSLLFPKFVLFAIPEQLTIANI